MMTAVLEWLRWMTEPDWISEVLHAIGDFHKKHNGTKNTAERDAGVVNAGSSTRDGEDVESRREDLDELEELGKFIYPIPLRLRDLQSMIRPFMEVHSHHRIAGLEAVG